MDRPYYEYTKGELRDEIARLQAEVERLHDVRETMAVMWAREQDRASAAWNVAIEAAAEKAEKHTECCQSCAAVGRPIRALKREAGNAP